MKSSWDPSSLSDLKGRTYIVTGGNTGYGYWTVYHLAKKHARVFLGCRNPDKGKQAINQIQQDIPDANIELLVMDLMDLTSVVQAAQHLRQKTTVLHGMVNSAGIMATPFLMSQDGYESQFQTNYLAHWLLTWHLTPLLQSTADKLHDADDANGAADTVRIVNVSSMGHNGAPSQGINFDDTSMPSAWTFRRYGQSKLANILHVKALEQRYGPSEGSGKSAIWSFSVHPGNANTQLTENSWGSSLNPLLRLLGVYISPEMGSFNSLFTVAGNTVTARDSGSYYVPVGKKQNPSKQAIDRDLAEKLWQWTETELRGKGLIQ